MRFASNKRPGSAQSKGAPHPRSNTVSQQKKGGDNSGGRGTMQQVDVVYNMEPDST